MYMIKLARAYRGIVEMQFHMLHACRCTQSRILKPCIAHSHPRAHSACRHQYTHAQTHTHTVTVHSSLECVYTCVLHVYAHLSAQVDTSTCMHATSIMHKLNAYTLWLCSRNLYPALLCCSMLAFEDPLSRGSLQKFSRAPP